MSVTEEENEMHTTERHDCQWHWRAVTGDITCAEFDKLTIKADAGDFDAQQKVHVAKQLCKTYDAFCDREAKAEYMPFYDEWQHVMWDTLESCKVSACMSRGVCIDGNLTYKQSDLATDADIELALQQYTSRVRDEIVRIRESRRQYLEAHVIAKRNSNIWPGSRACGVQTRGE
jgi:hypothetical protein